MSDPKVISKGVPAGDLRGGSIIKTPPKPTSTGQSKPDNGADDKQ